MAKINHILFGQGKGKVGGLVLQRYEGLNVVREKPISVKNPQSNAQTIQRLKLKTASQIVAQFKEVFTLRLSPLSIYTRARRSNAIEAIIRSLSIDQSNSVIVNLADIISAINNKSLSSLEAPTLTKTSNEFSIVAPDGDVVTYVHNMYDDDGMLIKREVATYESDGTAKSVLFDASSSSENVMVVATRATTNAGRAYLDNTTYGESGETIFDNTMERLVNSGDLSVTMLAGDNFTRN